MRKIILFLVLAISCLKTLAQDADHEVMPFYMEEKRVKIISVEPMGGSGYLSLNYDFRFMKQSNSLGMKIGVSFFSYEMNEKSNKIISPTLQLNYLIGAQSHKLEIGCGFVSPTSSNNFLLPIGVVNYRYYAPYEPLVVYGGVGFILIKPYLQLGFGFRL